MPTKPKKNGRQNYNWNLIMNDYISDPGSSLKKIAQKYGIRLATVEKRSKADNWFATKKEYQERVRVKALEKVGAKKAAELAGLVTISDHIERAIIKAIEKDPDYFYKHIISDNLSERDVELTILNTRAMKDMMRVIKDVEEVKRSILDIKKADVAESQRIAAERLQLERERFEFEKEKAEFNKPDTGAVIRIEGFEEGWDE